MDGVRLSDTQTVGSVRVAAYTQVVIQRQESTNERTGGTVG